jgi:hypothetical protein
MQPQTDSAGNVSVATVRLWNETLSRSAEAGSYDVAILIDPSALALCCGMNGSLAVYARLVDQTASDLADPLLLVGLNAPPSLTSYAGADLDAWRSHRGVQELALLVSSQDLAFFSAMNGR